MKAEDRSGFDPDEPVAPRRSWFVPAIWIVHLAMFAVVFYVFVRVIPRYEYAFKNADMMLPGITQLVILLGNWFGSYWFIAAFVWLVGIGGLQLIYASGARWIARTFSWLMLLTTAGLLAFVVLGLESPQIIARGDARQAQDGRAP